MFTLDKIFPLVGHFLKHIQNGTFVARHKPNATGQGEITARHLIKEFKIRELKNVKDKKEANS